MRLVHRSYVAGVRQIFGGLLAGIIGVIGGAFIRPLRGQSLGKDQGKMREDGCPVGGVL
jgi:hypothetical protein